MEAFQGNWSDNHCLLLHLETRWTSCTSAVQVVLVTVWSVFLDSSSFGDLEAFSEQAWGLISYGSHTEHLHGHLMRCQSRLWLRLQSHWTFAWASHEMSKQAMAKTPVTLNICMGISWDVKAGYGSDSSHTEHLHGHLMRCQSRLWLRLKDSPTLMFKSQQAGQWLGDSVTIWHWFSIFSFVQN